MKKLLLILLPLVAADLYKETQNFQYSRSDSDAGEKKGFYESQSGNMGGNYEESRNMDTLAQRQMKGLMETVGSQLGIHPGAIGTGALDQMGAGSVYGSASTSGKTFGAKASNSGLESDRYGSNRHIGTAGYDESQREYSSSFANRGQRVGVHTGSNYEDSHLNAGGVRTSGAQSVLRQGGERRYTTGTRYRTASTDTDAHHGDIATSGLSSGARQSTAVHGGNRYVSGTRYHTADNVGRYDTTADQLGETGALVGEHRAVYVPVADVREHTPVSGVTSTGTRVTDGRYHTSASGYEQRQAEFATSGSQNTGTTVVRPVPVYVRPGSTVRLTVRPNQVVPIQIPVSANTHRVESGYTQGAEYDASSSHSSRNIGSESQLALTESEGTAGTHGAGSVGYTGSDRARTSGTAKGYQASYSYQKEWERRGTSGDSRHHVPESNVDVTNMGVVAQNRDKFVVGTVDLGMEDRGSTVYNSGSRVATTGRKYDNSQIYQESKGETSETGYRTDSRNTAYGANINLDQRAGLNTYNQEVDTKPKSYQSSYSYHKSWEKHGTPYTIQPGRRIDAAEGYEDNLEGQTHDTSHMTAEQRSRYDESQRLASASHSRGGEYSSRDSSFSATGGSRSDGLSVDMATMQERLRNQMAQACPECSKGNKGYSASYSYSAQRSYGGHDQTSSNGERNDQHRYKRGANNQHYPSRHHHLAFHDQDMGQETEDLGQLTMDFGQQTENLDQEFEKPNYPYSYNLHVNKPTHTYSHRSEEESTFTIKNKQLPEEIPEPPKPWVNQPYPGVVNQHPSYQTPYKYDGNEDLKKQISSLLTIIEKELEPMSAASNRERSHIHLNKPSIDELQREDLGEHTVQAGKPEKYVDINGKLRNTGKEQKLEQDSRLSFQLKENSPKNYEGLGQETQDFGQLTVDLGQQTQDFGRLTNDRKLSSQFNEKPAKNYGDLGQETQDFGHLTIDFGQQTQDFGRLTDDHKLSSQFNEKPAKNYQDLGQRTQDFDRLTDDHKLSSQFKEKPANYGDLGQETQDFGQLSEDLGQKTDDLSQKPGLWDKELSQSNLYLINHPIRKQQSQNGHLGHIEKENTGPVVEYEKPEVDLGQKTQDYSQSASQNYFTSFNLESQLHHNKNLEQKTENIEQQTQDISPHYGHKKAIIDEEYMMPPSVIQENEFFGQKNTPKQYEGQSFLYHSGLYEINKEEKFHDKTPDRKPHEYANLNIPKVTETIPQQEPKVDIYHHDDKEFDDKVSKQLDEIMKALGTSNFHNDGHTTQAKMNNLQKKSDPVSTSSSEEIHKPFESQNLETHNKIGNDILPKRNFSVYNMQEQERERNEWAHRMEQELTKIDREETPESASHTKPKYGFIPNYKDKSNEEKTHKNTWISTKSSEEINENKKNKNKSSEEKTDKNKWISEKSSEEISEHKHNKNKNSEEDNGKNNRGKARSFLEMFIPEHRKLDRTTEKYIEPYQPKIEINIPVIVVEEKEVEPDDVGQQVQQVPWEGMDIDLGQQTLHENYDLGQETIQVDNYEVGQQTIQEKHLGQQPLGASWRGELNIQRNQKEEDYSPHRQSPQITANDNKINSNKPDMEYVVESKTTTMKLPMLYQEEKLNVTTPKPGFWKRVGDNLDKAKGKVSGWLG